MNNEGNIVIFVDSDNKGLHLSINSGFDLESTKILLSRMLELLNDPQNQHILSSDN